MTSYNAANERMKRQYFGYLAEAHGHSEQTIDATAKAIARFEAYTRCKDFKSFHIEQPRLSRSRRAAGPPQRLAAERCTPPLTALKRFFVWLAGQPDYKSRIFYLEEISDD